MFINFLIVASWDLDTRFNIQRE